MKAKSFSLILVLFTIFVSTAFAQPYVGLNVGASIVPDSNLSDNSGSSEMSYNNGLAVSGAGGFDFGLSRIELEIGYRSNDVGSINSNGVYSVVSGTVEVLSYMLNGYLVAPFYDPVKPYVMAGAGLTRMHAGSLKLDGVQISGSAANSQFAYQVGFGAAYDVAHNISLDAGYRYFGTGDFDLNGTKVGYSSHNMLLGCRYSF